MAARYWLGTTSTAWGTTANWSATSGGGGGASVPTSADDVTFDGAGNNPCELNTSARSCLSLTVSGGFTNTITHTQQLTVSGNITLHNGYTIAGVGLLVIGASSTIVSGGKVWPNSVTLSNTTGLTYTINTDTFTVTGTLTIGTGATTTFAGTHGFTCGTLTCDNTGATTINFKEAVEYKATTLLSAYLSRTGSVILFTSAHASTKTILTLQNGAECRCLANFTRVNAGNGRPIRSYNGVLVSTDNILSITDLRTAGGSL